MWSYLIRLLVVAVTLGLLYAFGLLRFEHLAALTHEPGKVGLCLLLMFSTMPLAALRWHLLLRYQGFRMSFPRTFSVVYVGAFFNAFLPGAYGGDIVRAGYVYYGARTHAGRLLFSIFVDRLTGLVGLIVLGFVAQLLLPAALRSNVTIMLGVFFGALLAGIAFLLIGSRVLSYLAKRSTSPLAARFLRLLPKIRMAYDIYVERWYVLPIAVAISIVQFVCVLAGLVVLAGAFDFAKAEPLTVALAGVFSLAASAIPVTPGGIGIGEAAFANAVFLIDPAANGPYATIFLAQRGLTLLISLFGGLVFLLLRQEMIEYVEEGRTVT